MYLLSEDFLKSSGSREEDSINIFMFFLSISILSYSSRNSNPLINGILTSKKITSGLIRPSLKDLIASRGRTDNNNILGKIAGFQNFTGDKIIYIIVIDKQTCFKANSH